MARMKERQTLVN